MKKIIFFVLFKISNLLLFIRVCLQIFWIHKYVLSTSMYYTSFRTFFLFRAATEWNKNEMNFLSITICSCCLLWSDAKFPFSFCLWGYYFNEQERKIIYNQSAWLEKILIQPFFENCFSKILKNIYLIHLILWIHKPIQKDDEFTNKLIIM